MQLKRAFPTPLQRGIAAVEFGITGMLLVTLLMAASEFGRAMVQYDTLVKSARAASRYLSQFQPGDANAITAAQNLAVYGRTSNSGSPLVPGLATSMVTVCDASSCIGTHKRQPPGGPVYVNLVTVTISGLQFQPLASWLLTNFTFDPITATMTQGVG